MIASPAPLGVFKSTKTDGTPNANGVLKTYASGTNTPQATYTDSTLGTPNAVEVALDANGQANVWLGSLVYRFDLFAADGTRLPGYPQDGIQDSGNGVLVDLADATDSALGDALVAVKSTPPNTVATTQHEVNERTRYVTDWMSAAMRADVAAGTALVDCAPAFQAALNWAFGNGGARILVPKGLYLISTMIDWSWATGAQNTVLEGEGPSVTRLKNGITHATAADPCIRMVALGNRHCIKNLSIEGNGVSGAGGNGHAIAVMDTRAGAGSTTWDNQQSSIENVYIKDHLGFAKDVAGAAMAACGIYVYASLDFAVRKVPVYNCKHGLWLEKCEKSDTYGFLADGCINTCITHKSVLGITHFGAVLNGSGSGGAQDGLVYFALSRGCHFFGGRMKNANPVVINLYDNTLNQDITFHGVSLGQMDSASGHTIAKVGTGCHAPSIVDCLFEWVGTITDAVGIDVVQAYAGESCSALRVDGCKFFIGDGGTVTACIRIAPTSNRARGTTIIGNSFGKLGNAGSATTYTDVILLDQRTEQTVIAGNSFTANNNVTLTACIRIASANVLGTTIMGNGYDGFGTITAKVVNSVAAKTTTVNDPSAADGQVMTNTAVLLDAAPTVAANQLGLGRTTATTVGASGAASALPANPLGYLIANLGGTAIKIPYYNN